MAVVQMKGVRVVVSSRRMQAFDQSVFRHVGIEPAQERILCLQNVSNRAQFFQADLSALGLAQGGAMQDLVSGKRCLVGSNGPLSLTLEPYQVAWLKTLDPPTE